MNILIAHTRLVLVFRESSQYDPIFELFDLVQMTRKIYGNRLAPKVRPAGEERNRVVAAGVSGRTASDGGRRRRLNSGINTDA